MAKSITKYISTLCVVLLAATALLSCSKSGGDGGEPNGTTIGAASADYIVLAWNDLGMHCLNPTYDNAVILPPYNTVWAQVIKRGNPPINVTSGITVEYQIVNNTYSYGKRSYGQFWDNALALFGVTLTKDTGLNLLDPSVHNGLSGTMLQKTDHYQVTGIPLTPVDDSGVWNPYQVAVITVRDQATGAILATTRATTPTSDEINCSKCHGSDPLLDVLQKHDKNTGTTLVTSRPVLCAQCHGTPALGQTGPGSSGKYLSEAVHTFHASKGAVCYDCHPGATTQCSRSISHTAADGNCTTCHGDMNQVGGSITAGTRMPWLDEPKCVTCHIGVAEVDTGDSLYRYGIGHGGIYCAGCHGSPHAMVPSNQASDNYQAIQYQSVAKSLGSCGVCHSGSKGDGLGEFLNQHGSGVSACSVCHTAITTINTALWPHQYQWKNR